MTLPRDHPRGPVAAFAQLVLCIGLWLVAGCSADEVSDESAGDGADDLVSGEVEPTSDSTTTTTTIGVSRSQPNILLLIADDYGVESSACYPELALDRAAPTPRLAELCEEGVVFENAWSSPTCSPTRAGMLTGRHSFRTGVGEQETRDNSVSIGPDELTLPRILDSADSGYRHASFGKWHLGGEADNPNVMGWGHFSGLFTGALRDYESWTKTVDGETETVEQYATTETVDDALGWIGTGEDPWLAWVAFNAPHTPFHLPPEELHTATLSGEDTDIEANPGVYYDAAMEALDNEVGRLLDGLSPEVRSNTVIVFVGDNGSPARVSSHQRGQAKGGLYEGGIHVPLAVSGPGIVTERSDALVGTVDIFATVLDMAGIDADHQLASTETDSISFRDVLVGGEGGSQVVLSEIFGSDTSANREGKAIRNDRYKVIDFSNGQIEFFDLIADPRGELPIDEQTRSEAENQVFDELLTTLRTWTADSSAPRPG